MTDRPHDREPLGATGVLAGRPAVAADPVGTGRPARPAAGVPGQRSAGPDVVPGGETSIRVLLVEQERSSRDGLRARLGDLGVLDVQVADSAAAAHEAIASGRAGDVAIVGLSLGQGARSLIHDLREAGWDRILALAPAAEIGPVVDALGAGVTGVLIGRRAMQAGGSASHAVHDLSAREVEVLRLVADGRSNKWIGEELSLSALTVKSHLARIGRKLGTGDRAQMVALAMRAGVVA